MPSDRSFFKNKWTWIIGIPALLIVIFVGGPFVYINFIEGDPPAKPDFSTIDSTKSGDTSSTTATASGVNGTWAVASTSEFQYRVPETLFGQSATAVGSTNSVTGDMTIANDSVESATFTADLTTVTSDQDNRDRQFQGRIMDTANFPNATFKLTSPIALAPVPANGVQKTYKATGDLTLHGTTKSVTFDLTALRNGNTIEVKGSIPITFSDYGIPAPSFGPAEVGETGELAFVAAFDPA